MRILITGGCGFVGSNLALFLKHAYPSYHVISLDNLKRRGSELNIVRLKEAGIEFIHGDMRCEEDLDAVEVCDLVIDASAEPSVLAGINSSQRQLINNNLISTVNALEYCAKNQSKFIFLSTSRVYPIDLLESAAFEEKETRFEWLGQQQVSGISRQGISEPFPMDGYRSLYGATKYASEILIREYIQFSNVSAIINRCGVISGPWQMGKIDQGVIVLWLARHIYKKPLQYIGYGGKGKQIRDILHIEDLCRLIDIQIHQWDKARDQVFNVGGGYENSVSLLELSGLVEGITGNRIDITAVQENRPADIRIYITDNSKVMNLLQWKPEKNIRTLLEESYHWIRENQSNLKHILE